MLPAALIILCLGGKPSAAGCVERCSADMTKCMGPCGQNQRCMDSCNKSSQRCNTGCATAQTSSSARAHEQESRIPCGIDEKTQKVIPCTDKEVGEMKASARDAKGLCKDDEGLPAPCPGDRERVKEKLKKQGIDLDCTDSNGVPIVCPPRNK